MVGHPSSMIQYKVESTLPHAANMSLIHGLCMNGVGPYTNALVIVARIAPKPMSFVKCETTAKGIYGEKKTFRCRLSANAGQDREHFTSQFSVQLEILNAGKR